MAHWHEQIPAIEKEGKKEKKEVWFILKPTNKIDQLKSFIFFQEDEEEGSERIIKWVENGSSSVH